MSNICIYVISRVCPAGTTNLTVEMTGRQTERQTETESGRERDRQSNGSLKTGSSLEKTVYSKWI